MPNDNSQYAFGLDFYEGNSVRSWDVLAQWSKQPTFAYFRLGIGLHVDARDLIIGCQSATTWAIGQYYEVWLPDVPKNDQLEVVQKNRDAAATLPFAIAYEEQGYEDKKGNKIVEWPSVGDLQYLMDNVPGSICYTSLAGLDEIKKALGSIPTQWQFWIARYLDAATLEAPVSDTLTLLKQKYGIDPTRVLFMQTCQAGAYPQGASYDKGADYDRRLTVEAPPIPTPTPSTKSFVVNAAKGLNVRAAADVNAPIVGGLQNGDTLYGEQDGDWVKLEGYVSSAFLIAPGTQPSPTPAPSPVPSGVFYEVLHDEDMPPDFLPRMLQRGSGLQSDKGVPETVNLDNSTAVVLDGALQHFIFANLKMSAPDMSQADLEKAFTSLLGAHEAFANNTGFATKDSDEPRWNVVTGANSSSALPKLDRPRVTGGAVVKVLDETPVNVGGVPHLKVETIKASNIPSLSQVNYELTPWLVFKCTTVTPFPVSPGSNRYRCNPFPQLGGRDVPMALVTNEGFGFIEVARLRKVASPFDHSPYVP